MISLMSLDKPLTVASSSVVGCASRAMLCLGYIVLDQVH